MVENSRRLLPDSSGGRKSWPPGVGSSCGCVPPGGSWERLLRHPLQLPEALPPSPQPALEHLQIPGSPTTENQPQGLSSGGQEAQLVSALGSLVTTKETGAPVP